MSSEKNGERLSNGRRLLISDNYSGLFQNKNINANPNNSIPPHTALLQLNTFFPSNGPKGIKLNSPNQILMENPVENTVDCENKEPNPKNIIANA